MADLTEDKSALQIKIVGSDSTGSETNEVGASTNGMLVDVAASVLPTGAATSSLQTTGNVSIASIDSKITAVGGQVQVRDSINTSSLNAALSVATTAIEAKVGASRLTNRKFLSITPTNGTIYWGSTSVVTALNGTPIFKNQCITMAFTDNVAVWLIGIATTDVRIVEGA